MNPRLMPGLITPEALCDEVESFIDRRPGPHPGYDGMGIQVTIRRALEARDARIAELEANAAVKDRRYEDMKYVIRKFGENRGEALWEIIKLRRDLAVVSEEADKLRAEQSQLRAENIP